MADFCNCLSVSGLQYWCAAPGDKPAHKKLTAWILAKQVENATKAKIVGQAKKRINIAALALVRNMGVLEIIEARLPRWLDHDDRKDLVADMWTAIGLGHLLPADIPRRAKEFVSAHRKKYTNTGRYAFNSLDAPTSVDNPTTRIERPTESDRMWWSADHPAISWSQDWALAHIRQSY